MNKKLDTFRTGQYTIEIELNKQEWSVGMRSNVDKYFEGYEKQEVEKKNGRGTVKKYVYTGNYMHIKKEVSEVKKYKLIYGLFYVIFIGLYFFTSFLDTNASHTVYVGLISLAILIPAVYWLGGLWNFLSAGEYMEQRKYVFGLKRITSSTKAMLWLSAAQIVGEIIFLIVKRGEITNYFVEIQFIVFAAIEVVVLNLFLRIQKKLEIEEVPNVLVDKKNPA